MAGAFITPLPTCHIIKLGSAAVAKPDGKPHLALLRAVVAQIAQRRARGENIILVSSGAVALGLAANGIERTPWLTPADKAVAAGAGQVLLMATFGRLFRKQGLRPPVQVLLESHNFTMKDNTPLYNVRDVLTHCFGQPMTVPVLNENDPVSRVELKGLEPSDPYQMTDNDGLACNVGMMMQAQSVTFVSQHCLYTKNPALPGAKPVPFVNFADDANSPKGLQISTEGKSCTGTGGTTSRLEQIEGFLEGKGSEFRRAHILDVKSVIKGGLLKLEDATPPGTLLVRRPSAAQAATPRLRAAKAVTPR